MKQVAQNYKSGELAVARRARPRRASPGACWCARCYSLISTGTEMMKVSEARLSLVGKARARPDQVRKLLDSVAQQGAVATYQKAMNRLDSYTPLGYSLCGVVVEVGAGAERVLGRPARRRRGQRVRAARRGELGADQPVRPGAGRASRPSTPRSPPSARSPCRASGAPRSRSARRRASSGSAGRPARGAAARRLRRPGRRSRHRRGPVPHRREGRRTVCAAPDDGRRASRWSGVLLERTGGLGADHVFLAAGGDSNGPVEVAARLARDRAGSSTSARPELDLPWNAYYEKELDVRFSRSYGPGRYDDRYELEGIDYPAGYVRWTERRNLACFLDLLVDGSVDVASLVSGVHPVEEAADVYGRLATGDCRASGSCCPTADTGGRRRPSARTARDGAGSTRAVRVAAPCDRRARAAWLHRRRQLRDVDAAAAPARARAASSSSRWRPRPSLSGVNAQRKFGFRTMTTDVDAVLDDDVARRRVRRDPAPLARAARVPAPSNAGKAVFVEKPLALTDEQLAGGPRTCRERPATTGSWSASTGASRRSFTDLQERFGRPGEPGVGALPGQRRPARRRQLVPQRRTRGSRFAGEGGHFIDTLSALVGTDPVEVVRARAPARDLARHAALRRRVGRHDLLRHRRAARFPEGDPRRRRRRPQRAAGQLPAGHGVVGPRARRQRGARRARTRASGRSWSASSRPCARAPRCRSRWSRSSRRPARRSPSGPACRPEGRWPGEPPSPGWYVAPTARMSPAEVAYRSLDAGRRRLWARRQVRPGDRGALPSRHPADRDVPRRRCRRGPRRRRTGRSQPPSSRPPTGCSTGLDRARRPAPRQRRPGLVPRPGHRAARSPGPALAFRIHHRDEAETGNIKQVWEMSRHHHLTVLAAAWWLTRDERYAEAVADQLRSWWRANPFLTGVHWTSGIEAGHPADLLDLDPPAARRLAQGRRPVRAQRRRRAPDPLAPGVPGRLPQPRLVGQQPRHRRGGRPARRRLRVSLVFPRATAGAQRCSRPAGARAGRQHLRRRAQPRAGDRLPPIRPRARAGGRRRGGRRRARRSRQPTWQRLARMLDAAAAIVDATGRPPRQGDGDEGRALVVDDPERDPVGCVLAAGARCSGAATGGRDSRALSRRTVFGALGGSRQLPDRGAGHVGSPTPGWCCCGRRPEDGPEIWCRCDGGPHGFLSIAAHAHADALSVEVRHDGVDILADPGTYCYHGEPEWREWFRSTAAHNTVEIGGVSQAVGWSLSLEHPPSDHHTEL